MGEGGQTRGGRGREDQRVGEGGQTRGGRGWADQRVGEGGQTRGWARVGRQGLDERLKIWTV